MSAYSRYLDIIKDFDNSKLNRLNVIEWLIDHHSDKLRRSGRSFLMAIAFVRQALKNPNHNIEVFDHSGLLQNSKIIIDTISDLFGETIKISHPNRIRACYESDKVQSMLKNIFGVSETNTYFISLLEEVLSLCKQNGISNDEIFTTFTKFITEPVLDS